MWRDCIDKLTGLVAVSGWGAIAAAESGASLAALAEPVSGAAVLATGLALQLRQNKRDICASALERVRNEVERETLRALEGNTEHRAAIEALFAELTQALDESRPSIEDIVDRWRFDPATIASGLFERVSERSETARTNHVARQVVITLIARSVAAVKDDPELYKKIEPAIARKLLDESGLVLSTVLSIREAVERLPAAVVAEIGDRETLVAELSAVKERLHATVSLIAEFLRLMVDREVPPDQFAATLFTNLEGWKAAGQKLRQMGRSGNLLPGLSDLRKRAERAQREERIDDFWLLVEEIDRIEQREYDRFEGRRQEWENEAAARRESLLKSKAVKRDAATAASRPTDVARTIVEIVDLSATPLQDRFIALRRLQEQWYVRGRDKGSRLDLEVSIELARLSVYRAGNADQKGVAQNDLGNALQILGGRESGTARLDEAVVAYRAALIENTREHTPLDWATTKNNLGIALQTLGERDSGTARMEQAIIAYRAALEERTRERAPLAWATTLNNLGNALRSLGGRERGTARLEEAVAAYRAALEERTRSRVPLDWAMTQNNLGIALRTLGERTGGTTALEEAVVAYRAALKERTRERVPLGWAMTQNNLGAALKTLGERESDTVRLEEAIIAYRAALEERTRERVPLDWAMTQNNLGAALKALGERETGTALLEVAVATYGAALEERTRERVPLAWATTQNNLGNALQTLGERESDMARLEEAVNAYHAALEERSRERVPFDWAMTQNNMASVFLALALKTNERQWLEQALAAADAALAVLSEAGAPFYLEKGERLRSNILAAISAAAE